MTWRRVGVRVDTTHPLIGRCHAAVHHPQRVRGRPCGPPRQRHVEIVPPAPLAVWRSCCRLPLKDVAKSVCSGNVARSHDHGLLYDLPSLREQDRAVPICLGWFQRPGGRRGLYRSTPHLSGAVGMACGRPPGLGSAEQLGGQPELPLRRSSDSVGVVVGVPGAGSRGLKSRSVFRLLDRRAERASRRQEQPAGRRMPDSTRARRRRL